MKLNEATTEYEVMRREADASHAVYCGCLRMWKRQDCGASTDRHLG